MLQNFQFILFILLVVSAVVGLSDIIFFAPKRKQIAQQAADFSSLSKKERQLRLKAPLVADYARSLFPVFLLVFLLRSFVVELYRVPSGSMLPTIQLNDFMLVNKFAYGIKIPFSNTTLISVGEPKRGDIVVFQYPAYPKVDYIKTLVGLPGDKISYINKKLYINGKPIPDKFIQNTIEPDNKYLASSNSNTNISPLLVKESIETFGQHEHHIYNSPIVPATDFKDLIVPKGEYFMMGDNRDVSDDSRYWGFVPEKDIVGKAELILFSWDSRTYSVRWNRIFKLLP